MDRLLSGNDHPVPEGGLVAMATFIPERVGTSSARSIHLKRALSSMDDAYVVRTPLRQSEWAPDLFVQHPRDGWLAIMVADTPFSVLVDDQLFGNSEREVFDGKLLAFQTWSFIPGAVETIGKLVVMWSCSPEEVQPISGQYLAKFGIRLLSRNQFLELGAKLVPRLLTKIGSDIENALMQHCFPEAEIHSSCTTRRQFIRDNSAKLQRFFLDHQQEWASKLDLDPKEQAEVSRDLSVRLVNGVAGSGKTLIALSRALLLSELFPHQQVLVLIHNTPVVADIKANLMRTRSTLPDNLEISTFFAWVHRQWRNVFQSFPKLIDGTKIEDLIRHYRTRWPDIKQSETQLLEEMDFINESLITDSEQYFNTNRVGRGFALRSKDRVSVWELFVTVTSALESSGQKLWSSLPLEVCQSTWHDRMEKYDHVLVDEAQFFAPSWFQTVKLAMSDGASLFLCADPNQGFMRNRLSWKSVGLDVAGRTKKLRRSYRTTQAILESASAILAQHTHGDTEDFLVPDMSGMEKGVSPMLIYADSPQDSVDRLVKELHANISGKTIALGDVLIIYGEKVQKKLLYDRLCNCFGEDSVWWFNKDKKEPPHGYERSYLRMANLDTATGLEAGVVFLIGVENLLVEAGEIRSDDTDLTGREERTRKLYMAMTRAGWYLVLLSSQRLPQDVAMGFHELRQTQE